MPNRQENNSIIQIIPIQNETPLTYKGNAKSYCRIRENNTIYSCKDNFTLENNNKTLSVEFVQDNDKGNPSKQKYRYNFNEIFGTDTKNREIYEKVCKVSVEQLFSKHKNSLIFVYVITNSGKTYKINGDLENPGLLQYSLIDIIEEYNKLKQKNNLWQLTCTYIERYNEKILEERKKLKLAGSTSNKVYPQGATIKNLEKYEDLNIYLN